MYSPVHRGPYVQQGKGFGRIFASLFRVIKPLLSAAAKDKHVRKAARTLKKTAIQGGTKKLQQLISKQAVAPKQQMSNARKRVLTAANLRRKKQKTIFD